MNTIITSKEAILSASQILAVEKGLPSISIRDVAARCGVSVGSVYNYFPSKADLIAATVKQVWETIFHNAEQHSQPEGFAEQVVWLYDTIQRGSAEYPSFFTIHSMSFAGGGKEKGREIMENYFLRMKAGLLRALSHDPYVRENAFTENFTKRDFIDFIFTNILSLSMQQSKRCDMLIEVMQRTIY